MKRLLDLIAEQARKSVIEGYRADDLIAVAGTVGAVQEWLGQDEIREACRSDDDAGRSDAIDVLRVEAGRGLGE
jgi:hypothetical protein